MKLPEEELAVAIRLLKKNSSIHAVSSFLKRRSLAFSAGSWDALLSIRLKPALERGALTREDVLALIRESEEFGRQHVFLFRCPKTEVADLLNEDLIRKRLTALDL